MSSDIQSLVAEWSLIFLHTLASPQVLNVDASVEKSLVRPIVLRDQLLKDGLKVSLSTRTLLEEKKKKKDWLDSLHI